MFDQKLGSTAQPSWHIKLTIMNSLFSLDKIQGTQSSSRSSIPARINLQPCTTLCRDPQPSHMGPLTNRNSEILTDAVQSQGMCGHQLHTSRKCATWRERLL